MSRIAKTTLVMALLSVTLLPLSALGTRWGLFDFRIGLLLFMLATLTGLTAIVLSALYTRRQHSDKSRQALNYAALLGLPALAFFAFNLFSGGSTPMIHNVTTDPSDPPEFIAAPAKRGAEANPLTYGGELAAIQQKAYPDLQTLTTELNSAEAFQLALATAKALDWEIYYQDAAAQQIEAVATTRWFGFKDDVVIRIRGTGSGSEVDLRSVSRVGKGDLGANAKRIAAFLERFREEI